MFRKACYVLILALNLKKERDDIFARVILALNQKRREMIIFFLISCKLRDFKPPQFVFFLKKIVNNCGGFNPHKTNRRNLLFFKKIIIIEAVLTAAIITAANILRQRILRRFLK